MKKRLPVILSILLGLALVAVWLALVDLHKTLELLKSVRVILLLPLAALFFLTYFLRSLRWKIILSPVVDVSAAESFKLCLSNYLINFLVPIHAGEIAKSYWLKKMKGTPVSQSLLTAYLDKITDALPVFLLLLLVPFLNSRLKTVLLIISGISLVVFALVGVFLVFVVRKQKAALVLLNRVLFFLPDKLKTKAGNFLSLFVQGAAALPRLWRRLPEIFGLTALSLLCHCGLLWLYFYAFGVRLPAITALAAYLMLNATFFLPAPPGFSGSLELAMLFIFSYLFGYDKNVVSAVAASSHLFTAVLFGLGGFVSIALIGTRLSSLWRAGAGRVGGEGGGELSGGQS